MGRGTIDSDVLIVGGGLVGSLLANALRQIPVSVTIVEAREPRRLEQPGFDGRATALANGSKRVLEQLGLWRSLSARAEPIKSIHVSEAGRFGAARIKAEEEGVPALGYTVENRALGEALWAPLTPSDDLQCLAPAELLGFDSGPDGVTASVARDGETLDIRAGLMVAADGTHSSVRQSLGIEAREDDYGQHALIVNCATEIAHAGRAFERFRPGGPLAFLPLTRDRVAVVWTLDAAQARAAMALPEAPFLQALQTAFGYRLGRIERVGERTQHRLHRLQSDAVIDRRIALIGNAAVSLHPVAGQGFNLALRDIATLAEVIADERARGADSADIGSTQVLGRYRQWRARDQKRVAAFTHGLVQSFGLTAPGLGVVRGLGLMAFDLLPGAKSWLARQTMGQAGRLPRLARQLKL